MEKDVILTMLMQSQPDNSKEQHPRKQFHVRFRHQTSCTRDRDPIKTIRYSLTISK